MSAVGGKSGLGALAAATTGINPFQMFAGEARLCLKSGVRASLANDVYQKLRIPGQLCASVRLGAGALRRPI